MCPHTMLSFDMIVLFGLKTVLISAISDLVAVHATSFLALGGLRLVLFTFVRVLFRLLFGLSKVV